MKYPVLAALAVAVASLHAADEAKPAAAAAPAPTFTQAQVNSGLLTFVHSDAGVVQASFGLKIQDEQFPTHAADSGYCDMLIHRST